MKKDIDCLVIGGSNMDIIGFPSAALRLADSNPGRVLLSPGGVARNIAENMVHLDLSVTMLSAVGDDLMGSRLVRHCRKAGINMEYVRQIPGVDTQVYMAVMDHEGDMAVAVSSMEAKEYISPEYLDSHRELFAGCRSIVVDANLTREALVYVFGNCGDVPVFADPVSAAKISRLEPFLSRIHTLKPNRLEAEVLLRRPVRSDAEAEEAVGALLARGLQQVYISAGSERIIYGSPSGSGWIQPAAVEAVNATGAGDAFLAGLVFGHLRGWNQRECCKAGTAAASVAVASEETIAPELTVPLMLRKMKEIDHDNL